MAGRDPGESESDVDVLVEEEQTTQTAEPPKYAVILHNDDYTTMEFVLEVLEKYFGKKGDQAHQIMMKVHHSGRGIAGIYSYEIAETKVAQVIQYARACGHPLMCSAEPMLGSSEK